MKSYIFLFSTIILGACSTPISTDPSTMKSIGGDKDNHGCLVGAGQSWSKVRQNCIQIFKEGIRLNPIEEPSKGEAVFSAFIVFSKDNQKVELYVPNEEDSFILNSVGEGIYKDSGYEFNSSTNSLLKNGVKIYQAN